MGRDYFSILFNRARFRTVSYLTPEESAEILEKPARESLEYDPAVLADAYRLIRGQPLLLQMLGAALIEQFKEQVRRGDGRSNEVDINDFTAIIERLVQAGSNAAFETLLLRGEKFGLNFYMGRYWYRRCTMKFVKHALIAAGIAAALMVIPSQTANAYWYGSGAGYAPWRHAYVHDPGYRRAPPWMKCFIRDLYRRGPEYASWRQSRRYGYGR